MKNIPQTEWDEQIQEVEQHMIRKALLLAAGNISLASRRLGISYPTIIGRIRRYGIKTRRAKA